MHSINNKKATNMNFFLHFNIGLRPYSTKPVNNYLDIKPIVIYRNCELEKDRILFDNKNKPVVYRWINNVNNKTYVGSSVGKVCVQH